MALTPEQKKLEDDRSKVYGDPRISHRAIGYAFRAVLQNVWHHLEIPPITEDITANLLQAFKVTRGARPVLHDDSYDDTHVYTDFAQRFKQALKDGTSPWDPNKENSHASGTDGTGGPAGGTVDQVPVPVLSSSRDGQGRETSRSITVRRRPKAGGSRSGGGRSIRRRG